MKWRSPMLSKIQMKPANLDVSIEEAMQLFVRRCRFRRNVYGKVCVA